MHFLFNGELRSNKLMYYSFSYVGYVVYSEAMIELLTDLATDFLSVKN